MVIDASALFGAKMFANTMQRDVGEAWKVQVEYSCNDNKPFDWYDIEFNLFEKATGKKHKIPGELFE